MTQRNVVKGKLGGNTLIGKCLVICWPLIGSLNRTPPVDQWEAASIFTSPDDSDVDYGSKHKRARDVLKLRHLVLWSKSLCFESV